MSSTATRLTLRVVLGDHATARTTRRVHDQLAARLRALGLIVDPGAPAAA